MQTINTIVRNNSLNIILKTSLYRVAEISIEVGMLTS